MKIFHVMHETNILGYEVVGVFAYIIIHVHREFFIER